MDLRRSLPFLLSMLAGRSGIKLTIGGDSAFHDPINSRVNIPAGDVNDPRYAVSAIGLTVHEGGHARFTQRADSYQPDASTPTGEAKLRRWIWNALEDIRMESCVIDDLPGARTYLSETVKVVKEDRGWLRVVTQEDGALAALQMYVLCRLRAEVLEQPCLNEAVAAEKALRHFVSDEVFDRITERMFEVCKADSTGAVTVLSNHIVDEVLDILSQPQAQDVQQDQVGSDSPTEEGDESDATEGASAQPSTNSSDVSDDQPSVNESSTGDNDTDGDSKEASNGGAANSDGSDAGDDTSDANGSGSSEPGSNDGEDSSDIGAGADGDADPDVDVGTADGKAGQQDGASSSDSSSDSSGGSTAGTGLAGQEVIKQLVSGDDTGIEADLGDVLAEAVKQLADRSQRGMQLDLSQPPQIADARPEMVPGLLAAVGRSSRLLSSRLQTALEAQSICEITHDAIGTDVDVERITHIFQGKTDVFRDEEDEPEVNSAVQILIDSSGSMLDDIDTANQAAAAAALAIDRIADCSVSVAAYPAKDSVLEVCSDFGESVRRTLPRFGVVASGGTPTAEAMHLCALRLATRHEQRKLLIVITDGQPSSVPATESAIKMLRNAGVEVVGIGIGGQGSAAVGRLFAPSAVGIDTVDDLPTELFGVLRRNFVRLAA